MSNPLAPLPPRSHAVDLEPRKCASVKEYVCLSECESNTFTRPDESTAAREDEDEEAPEGTRSRT
jgi:hypothetical protein